MQQKQLKTDGKTKRQRQMRDQLKRNHHNPTGDKDCCKDCYIEWLEAKNTKLIELLKEVDKELPYLASISSSAEHSKLELQKKIQAITNT